MSLEGSRTVRPASLDDAPAILSIYQDCDLFIGMSHRSQEIGLLDVIDWLESATYKHPFLVIEERGDVVGWCSLEPFYGLPAFDLANEISVYVRPMQQGQGVGAQLVRYLEVNRSVLGFTHLVAYVYASNVSSQRFFSHRGFEQWGRLPNIAQTPRMKEDVFLLGKEYSFDRG